MIEYYSVKFIERTIDLVARIQFNTVLTRTIIKKFTFHQYLGTDFICFGSGEDDIYGKIQIDSTIGDIYLGPNYYRICGDDWEILFRFAEKYFDFIKSIYDSYVTEGGTQNVL